MISKRIYYILHIFTIRKIRLYEEGLHSHLQLLMDCPRVKLSFSRWAAATSDVSLLETQPHCKQFLWKTRDTNNTHKNAALSKVRFYFYVQVKYIEKNERILQTSYNKYEPINCITSTTVMGVDGWGCGWVTTDDFTNGQNFGDYFSSCS